MPKCASNEELDEIINAKHLRTTIDVSNEQVIGFCKEIQRQREYIQKLNDKISSLEKQLLQSK